MILLPPVSTRPVTLFPYKTLFRSWGWSLFALTWGLAAAGVVFKIFATGRFERLSLFIYLAMGWCAIIARSEEHTSELQSLMRISYAVFCLKKKNDTNILT